MEIFKGLRQMRRENSKPRFVYFFPDYSLEKVVPVTEKIRSAVDMINQDQSPQLMTAILGNLDIMPAVYITVEKETHDDTLFGQKLRTLFTEVGSPTYIFNASKIDGLDAALEPLGKKSQKDSGWIGDVKQVVNIE